MNFMIFKAKFFLFLSLVKSPSQGFVFYLYHKRADILAKSDVDMQITAPLTFQWFKAIMPVSISNLGQVSLRDGWMHFQGREINGLKESTRYNKKKQFRLGLIQVW